MNNKKCKQVSHIKETNAVSCFEWGYCPSHGLLPNMGMLNQEFSAQQDPEGWGCPLGAYLLFFFFCLSFRCGGRLFFLSNSIQFSEAVVICDRAYVEWDRARGRLKLRDIPNRRLSRMSHTRQASPRAATLAA